MKFDPERILTLFPTLFEENNNLIGSLPNEFYALKQLESIDFNSNGAIYGSIPTFYGSIATLKVLDLFMNDLMGVLPAALCSATMLERIDVQSNSLVGKISTCIGMLQSLNMLTLDSNMFSGTLPSEVGHMSALGKYSLSTVTISYRRRAMRANQVPSTVQKNFLHWITILSRGKSQRSSVTIHTSEFFRCN